MKGAVQAFLALTANIMKSIPSTALTACALPAIAPTLDAFLGGDA